MARPPFNPRIPFLAAPVLGLFALSALVSTALWRHDPSRLHSIVSGLVGLGRAAAVVAVHVIRWWHDLLGNLL